MRGRLRQPAAHQGQPQRDEDRHARRRNPRSRRSAPVARTTSSPTIADAWRKSWVYEDLYKVRNVKPGLKWGMWARHAARRRPHVAQRPRARRARAAGRCIIGKADHESLQPAATMPRIDYPKYDGVLTFDKLSSVFLSNTNHEEDQPVHLQLRDPAIPVEVNLKRLRRAGSALLPGGRVRIRRRRAAGAEGKRLQINAQNCVHCKTCDIKDPRQNIHWVHARRRRRTELHEHVTAAHAGHSHAAPRTPLESPCALRTRRVSTRSENTQRPTAPAPLSYSRSDVRHPAAQHDHVGIEQVDHVRERAREPLLVARERGDAARVAGRGVGDDLARWARRGRVARSGLARMPGPDTHVSMQPRRPQ